MRVLAVSVARLASSMLAPPCALPPCRGSQPVQLSPTRRASVVLWRSFLGGWECTYKKGWESQFAFEIN